MPDADGVPRTWHVLDSRLSARRRPPAGDPPVGTLLCVHGNPTWSYLWRRVRWPPPRPAGGSSPSTSWHGLLRADRDAPRTLAQRIDDLGRLTDALEITGPVVTVAHDWGGPISLGWALAPPRPLAGVVLTNTAVHQPAGTAPPRR